MMQFGSAAAKTMLLLGLSLAGCGERPVDPVAPGDAAPPPVQPGPSTPPAASTAIALPTLGLGRVPERFTSEVAVRGAWAYSGSWGARGSAQVRGNALRIWNVAGNVPMLRDTIIVTNATTLGDVQISDDGALLVVATELVPGSLVIYDRSDPAAPRQIARYLDARVQAGVHTVKLGWVGGRHYAFLSANPTGSPSTPHLVILDITDPSRPRDVASRAMGNPFLHDVFVRDGILMAALWNDGIAIFDIGGGGRGGSPSNPVRLGGVRTVGGAAHNIWWFHDPASGSRRYAFVGEEQPGAMLSGAAGDIHVVDVSDFGDPREVAFFNVPGAGAHNFWMDEASGILYAAYYNGGVRALDVRGDLGGCAAAQRDPRGRCDLGAMGREAGVALREAAPVYTWGVQGSGNRLFASDMLHGLFVIDISPLRRP